MFVENKSSEDIDVAMDSFRKNSQVETLCDIWEMMHEVKHKGT